MPQWYIQTPAYSALYVYVQVSPGLIVTIWWSIAVWLAWKSIECGIFPWLTRWTRTVSPIFTRIVGAGTVPPNVQTWTTKPGATVMSFSMIGRSMSCTSPGSSVGAAGS